MGLTKVLSRSTPDLIKISGVFVPTRRVQIKSEFSGRLEDLSVVKGQTISTGNPLLRIADEELPLELDRLRAELLAAEAQLEQSRRLAREEPEERTVEEEVIEGQAEAPVEEIELEPTFSRLASEIPFVPLDAGGIWPGIDPRIIARADDPQDAGGIWPSYDGEREMVNGERSLLTLEPPVLAISLPTPSSPEPLLAPRITLSQVPPRVETPRVMETLAAPESSEAENLLSLNQAKADVIRAEIAITENELARRTLSSPLDGKVHEVGASEGSQVEPGDFLIEIFQVDPIEFSFKVPKDQVEFLELDMKIKGRLSGSPGVSFEGEISFIGAELSDDKKTVEVRARVSNPDEVLNVGMEGTAEIATGQKMSWVTSVRD